MLKFPLKEPILLIATSGKYICSVIYATNESVTIVDDIGKKYVNWRAQYRRSQMKLVNGGKN